MQQQALYLKEDVYFEPLLHNWYVWPYLLPPASAAMNFSGRNIRLMKSFVNNFQLHLSAIGNTNLTGGDFVNCSEEQVNDVRNLINDIEMQHSDYFELRAAITKLNEMLEGESGLTLEPLYEKIPSILRGYVELFYDMNHHASFRFIEGLMYEGSLYKESAQSISLGLLSKVKERPFVLSSPRFPDADHMHVRIPLSDSFLDTLFSLRNNPTSRANIDKLFLDKKLSGRLEIDELFTSIPPARCYPKLESDLRIRYLGHAGLLLETKSTSILVDPVIASRNAVDRDDFVGFCDLPEKIDYICVTHTHMDHVCIETLIQLRHKTGEVLVPKNSGGGIADPSIKLMLKKLGFHVREFEDMEELLCTDGKIKAIPFLGEHADLNIRSKTAWYFEFGGKKIFSGADSSSLDEVMYERIHQAIGDLDLLFIGMECIGAPMSWLYGSLFTKPIPRAMNESRRFNGSDFSSAKKIVEIFRPKEVYVYALGMEPRFRYFMGMDYSEDAKQIKESEQLLSFCEQKEIQSERLFSTRVWEITY